MRAAAIAGGRGSIVDRLMALQSSKAAGLQRTLPFARAIETQWWAELAMRFVALLVPFALAFIGLLLVPLPDQVWNPSVSAPGTASQTAVAVAATSTGSETTLAAVLPSQPKC